MIALVIAALPALLICDLWGFAVKAAVHCGHWPSYGNPDPKQLPWEIQLATLRLEWICAPWFTLIAIGAAIQGRLFSRQFPLWPAVLVTVLTGVVFVVYCRLDPVGMVAWLWD